MSERVWWLMDSHLDACCSVKSTSFGEPTIESPRLTFCWTSKSRHRRLRALAISSDYRYGKLHECSQKPTRVTYFRKFPERPDTGWATACSAAGAVSVLASGGGCPNPGQLRVDKSRGRAQTQQPTGRRADCAPDVTVSKRRRYSREMYDFTT